MLLIALHDCRGHFIQAHQDLFLGVGLRIVEVGIVEHQTDLTQLSVQHGDHGVQQGVGLAVLEFVECVQLLQHLLGRLLKVHGPPVEPEPVVLGEGVVERVAGVGVDELGDVDVEVVGQVDFSLYFGAQQQVQELSRRVAQLHQQLVGGGHEDAQPVLCYVGGDVDAVQHLAGVGLAGLDQLEQSGLG